MVTYKHIHFYWNHPPIIPIQAAAKYTCTHSSLHIIVHSRALMCLSLMFSVASRYNVYVKHWLLHWAQLRAAEPLAVS